MLVAIVIGLCAALILGLAAIRTVTRPLRAMTHTAERLARGDYDIPPPGPEHHGRDELGVLSHTLAVLAREMKARIEELTSARDLSTAVIDALVEGVVAIDAAGRVVLSNRAASTLLGEGGVDHLPASRPWRTSATRASSLASPRSAGRARRRCCSAPSTSTGC